MTQGPTPDARERARLQYHTLRDGDGWLRNEKEKIVLQKILPTINQLTNQYNRLQNELASHDNALQQKTQIQQEEVGDEEDARFVQKQLDEARVANRLFELGQPQTITSALPSMYTWLPYVLDVMTALLALAIVYLIFVAKKLNRFIWPVQAPVEVGIL